MPIELHTSMLPWISLIPLLLYIPVLCYLDWKYRDIGTHKIWLPLLAINIPIAVAGYLTGLYPTVLLLLTMLLSISWFLLFYRKGADCVWLILITMFAVVHPVNGTVFLYPFLMYLAIFTAGSYWFVLLDNRVRKGIWSLDMERGIPYLIPISAALIMAAVF